VTIYENQEWLKANIFKNVIFFLKRENNSLKLARNENCKTNNEQVMREH
jgi:hypothetical protein